MLYLAGHTILIDEGLKYDAIDVRVKKRKEKNVGL
jgi:hypothetical protein